MLLVILAFSVIGIRGSYGVAWFGIRVNTFANSRTAFASLRGKPFPSYTIPSACRHEHRHDADLRRAADDAYHPALRPRRLCRTLLHRFCHRRVAGRGRPAHRGRHLHQDCRHRLRPDEDRLQDQGRRCPQPRRHRRLHRRQRRRFGWALADGFETYGVTGVALITFILLAVKVPPCRFSCWSGSL